MYRSDRDDWLRLLLAFAMVGIALAGYLEYNSQQRMVGVYMTEAERKTAGAISAYGDSGMHIKPANEAFSLGKWLPECKIAFVDLIAAGSVEIFEHRAYLTHQGQMDMQEHDRVVNQMTKEAIDEEHTNHGVAETCLPVEAGS